MEKKTTVPAHIVSSCPGCGLFTGPHGTIEECIRALEAEVQRLTESLESFKNSARLSKLKPNGKP